MTKSVQSHEVSVSISDRRRLFEVVAVILTGLGKFVFIDVLNWKLPFIITVILGWSIYILSRKKKISGIFNYWGLTTNNFKTTALKVLSFGALAIILFFIIGYFQGTINLSWHILPILIVYPIWGTIQQLLMIGLIAGNLQDLKSRKINRKLIVISTAVLFAAVHYPNYWLIAGTFLLALFYSHVYLKVRNLYVLGLFHGWLGAFFYYTVVDRDPFMEVFGVLK